MNYKIRTREVIRKTSDVKDLDRKIAHFKRSKNVIIKKGWLKNYRGKIVGNIRPIYSKKDFLVNVKLKDLDKVFKKSVGKDTFLYKGSSLKPTVKPYKRYLPRWTSDVR